MGRALFAAVCELGFEGVVAKNHSSLYRANDRGWVKVKNPHYWRRDGRREAMSRKHERRAACRDAELRRVARELCPRPSGERLRHGATALQAN